jgi:hypothetical protein
MINKSAVNFGSLSTYSLIDPRAFVRIWGGRFPFVGADKNGDPAPILGRNLNEDFPIPGELRDIRRFEFGVSIGTATNRATFALGCASLQKFKRALNGLGRTALQHHCSPQGNTTGGRIESERVPFVPDDRNAERKY